VAATPEPNTAAIAVGWEGTLVLFDLAGDREIGRTAAHTGWITSVAWRGAELWTAGEDGALKRWDTGAGLALHETVQAGGAFSHLVLFDRGWAAAVDSQVLHVEASERPGPLHLDLGRWIRDRRGLDDPGSHGLLRSPSRDAAHRGRRAARDVRAIQRIGAPMKQSAHELVGIASFPLSKRRD
jgi:hypothetical protein